MSKLKRGLGRGLSSLIGETKSKNTSNVVPINDLIKNKFQPRKIFDEDKLNDLSKSILREAFCSP